MRISYDFYNKHFVQWLLYAGNKKPGTSLSGRWSRCEGGRYIERSLT